MAASGKSVLVTWTLSLAVCLCVCGLVPLPLSLSLSLSLSLFVLFVCWGGEGEARIFEVYLLVQTGVDLIPLEGLTILPCFLLGEWLLAGSFKVMGTFYFCKGFMITLFFFIYK